MIELKPITKEGIPRALEKIERYRLLNEPAEAESICRDIIGIEPGHQKALVMLILTLSDQFSKGVTEREATSLLPKLNDQYQRAYYKGIILERLAKAALNRSTHGSQFDAYEWLWEAMESFEKASALRPPGNDDSVLRWNACVRTIERYRLSPRGKEHAEPPLE
jgi:mannose/cellobiose epimerase-like protein (N-acyl-D-glucosamine 2-epimerase family)